MNGEVVRRKYVREKTGKQVIACLPVFIYGKAKVDHPSRSNVLGTKRNRRKPFASHGPLIHTHILKVLEFPP